MGAHALGAAAYAAKAAGLAAPDHPEAVSEEIRWQLAHLSTLEGLAAARARGKTGGRKPKLTEGQVKHARQLYADGEHTVAEIADLLGVSRQTVYRAPRARGRGQLGPPLLAIARLGVSRARGADAGGPRPGLGRLGIGRLPFPWTSENLW